VKPAAHSVSVTHPPRRYQAIVVGGSSGGINALAHILPSLRKTLSAGVLIVLHLPRDRRSMLVDIFRQRCELKLQEASDKDDIAAGAVYFAPPDYHMLVEGGSSIGLSVDPPVHFSRPSIDVLFESAADRYGESLVGILLSGANEDGAHGLQTIAEAGGLTIVQDPASAPMPTMPLAALTRIQPDHVLSPEAIAQLILDLQDSQQV
jgi:two-component system chemotaxis response regulator CheB